MTIKHKPSCGYFTGKLPPGCTKLMDQVLAINIRLLSRVMPDKLEIWEASPTLPGLMLQLDNITVGVIETCESQHKRIAELEKTLNALLPIMRKSHDINKEEGGAWWHETEAAISLAYSTLNKTD